MHNVLNCWETEIMIIANKENKFSGKEMNKIIAKINKSDWIANKIFIFIKSSYCSSIKSSKR